MIYLLVCDFMIILSSTNRLWPTGLCGGVHRLVRVFWVYVWQVWAPGFWLHLRRYFVQITFEIFTVCLQFACTNFIFTFFDFARDYFEYTFGITLKIQCWETEKKPCLIPSISQLKVVAWCIYLHVCIYANDTKYFHYNYRKYVFVYTWKFPVLFSKMQK